jgi:signal peptidase I
MMKIHYRWFLTFFSGISLVLAVVIWVVFAPTRLGGQNEYIFINGNSMEPAIQTGDLIVVKRARNYQVGDAVAYNNADINQVVFHRIIGREGTSFIFQGDHNSWVDSYKPTLAELIGKQWLHIPGAGKLILLVRKPLLAALAAGGAGGIILAFLLHKSKKKRTSGLPTTTHSENISSLAPPPLPGSSESISFPAQEDLSLALQKRPVSRPGMSASNLNSFIEISFFVLGILALGSITLLLFGFFNPLTRQTTNEYPYTQSGSYEYNAPAPIGVYDSQSVNSGDPIFTKLTCQVNLLFTYSVAGQGLDGLAGAHQLTAVLTEPTSGWTRTFALEPQQSFAGDNFSSLALVDLCQMQAVAKEMELQTGTSNYTYSLAIKPNVILSGKIQGVDLSSEFSTPLIFQLDAVKAYVNSPDAKIDSLHPVLESVQTHQVTEANAFRIFGFDLPVRSARNIGLIGLLLSFSGLTVLLFAISQSSKDNKEMLVRMKYGSSLVDVEPTTQNETRVSVNVKDIDDLAKLAERHNAVILHQLVGSIHNYLVEANGVFYQYSLSDDESRIKPDAQTTILELSDIRKGIQKGEFVVYYQPIVSILDRKIVAVEALLRWHHPTKGLVSAGDFISEAESTGLIGELGEIVLREALAQIRIWRNDGLPLRLAINMSQLELEQNPSNLIASVLRLNGLTPDSLLVEISENSLKSNPEQVLNSLKKLLSLGVHLSIDNYKGDFALELLDQISIEYLKIDRSLILTIDQPGSALGVQEIIAAALQRGIKIIAEGVENRSQINQLKSQFCTQAQGYFIARPAPAADITALLIGHSSNK